MADTERILRYVEAEMRTDWAAVKRSRRAYRNLPRDMDGWTQARAYGEKALAKAVLWTHIEMRRLLTDRHPETGARR